MPSFSARSLKNIAQLHPALAAICHAAIKDFDFTVLDAQRGRAEQELAFLRKTTKVRFGNSAHNYAPAIAMDIVPYPIDWDDLGRFKALGRIVLGHAKRLNVPIRWGADWNRNGKINDEGFLDFPHFELHPWRTYAAKSKLIED